ncbi:MAG: DUF2341 domain-containing protein [Patescibacteria group bacterium]
MKSRIYVSRARLVLVVLCLFLFTLTDTLKVFASSSPFTNTDWSNVSDYSSKSNINTTVAGEISLNHAGSDWFNQAWGFRRKITFDNSSQNENLTNFVVMVKLDSNRVNYANTQNNGEDIRFTDSDGTTKLSYEIEKWDETGTSIAWVKVPQIDASSSTDFIYMYYGNTTAASESDASSVWTDTARYHMNETTTTDANQFKGSGTYETGKFGQAIGVYGNSSGTYGSTLTFNRGAQISGNNYEHFNSNQGTVSFWFKPNWNSSDSSTHFLFTNGQSSHTGGFRTISIRKVSNYFDIALSGTGPKFMLANPTINAGSWYHAVVVWDSKNTVNGSSYAADFYVNGVSSVYNNSTGTSFVPSSVSDKLNIGSNALGYQTADAIIDDFAIFDRPLTTTEISDLYNGGTGRTADYVADSSLKFYAKLDGTGTLNAVNYNTAGNVDKTAYNSSTNSNGNLVVNGDFETSGSWTLYNSAPTMVITSAEKFSNTQSIHVVTNGLTQTQGTLQSFAATPTIGQNYHVEAWVKVVSGSMRSAIGYGFEQILTDDNGNSTISSNQWTRISTDFRVKTENTNTIYFTQSDNTASEFYVDNVSITPNLVNNGGMEGTISTNWSSLNSTIEADSTTKMSGSQSIKVSASADYGQANQTITLVTGQKYLLKYWYKASNGDAVRVLGYDNVNASTFYDSGNISATSWTKISTVITAPSTTMVLRLAARYNTDIVWFDDVSVIPLDNISTSFQSDTKVIDSLYGSEIATTNSGFETAGTGGTDVFSNWAEAVDAGSIVNETTSVHTGSYAAKLTNGASGTTRVAIPYVVQPNKTYKLTFYSRGDGANSGKFYLDNVNNGTSIIASTSVSVSETSFKKIERYFVAPVGCNNISLGFTAPSVNGASAYFDDVSLKEVLNPLSIHGDSDGVVSNTSSKIGNGYTFDGSTGFLKQKTYDTNVGTLSYGTNTISDTGQNFDDWDNDDGGIAEYMLVATNSDNTTSWGYLCTNSSPTTQVTIYTKKDCSTGANGFNGTSITGKTPVGYEIRKTDFQITGAFTTGAWIYANAVNSARPIITKSNFSNGYDVQPYVLMINNGYLTGNIGNSGGPVVGSQIQPNTWYYVTLTYDGSVISLYKDGVLDASLSRSGLIYQSFDYFSIAGNTNQAYHYIGSLDEAFIKPSAMTAEQIAATYKSENDTFGTYGSEEQYFASSGSLTSNIFDTQLSNVSLWGNLTYTTTVPTGTTLSIKARSSNSPTMSGAPAFSTCVAVSSGTDLSTNSCITDGHRYIQYEATLTSTNGVSTPTIQDVSIAFSSSDSNPPILTLNSPSSPNSDSTPSVTGNTQDSISSILSVEYQSDSSSGSWSSCTATDSAFDEQSEDFTCTLSTLTDGSHTIYFRSSDVNGNTTSSSYPSVSIVIDTQNPTTPGTPSTNTPTSDTTPSWTFTASSDPGGGDASGLANPAYTIEWSQSSSFSSNVQSSTTNSNTFTHVTPLTDGRWYIRIKSTDNAGNSSSYSQVSFVDINTGAPTGSVKINGNDEFTKTKNVTLSISASSGFFTDSSNIQMKISNLPDLSDASYESYIQSKPWTLPDGVDGEKTIYIQFKDSTGNTSGAYTDSIALDTTPPTPAEIIDPGNNSYTSSKRPTFKFKVNSNPDSLSGISKYKLTLRNEGDDNQTFPINDIPANRTETYEDLRYTITYHNFNDSNNDNNYISVSTHDSLTWGSADNKGELKEGTNIWSVVAVDKAGNESESRRTVFADFTGPNVYLQNVNEAKVNPTDNRVVVSTTNTKPVISGKIEDLRSGMRNSLVVSGPNSLEIGLEKLGYFGTYNLIGLTTLSIKDIYFAGSDKSVLVDDNSVQQYDKFSSFEYKVPQDLEIGQYRLKLRGKDIAGNFGAEKIIEIKIGNFDDVALPEQKAEVKHVVEEQILTPTIKNSEKDKTEENKKKLIEDIGKKVEITNVNNTPDKTASIKTNLQIFDAGKNTLSFVRDVSLSALHTSFRGIQIVGSIIGGGVNTIGEVSKSTTKVITIGAASGLQFSVKAIQQVVGTVGQSYYGLAKAAPIFLGSNMKILGDGVTFIGSNIFLAGQKTTLSIGTISGNSLKFAGTKVSEIGQSITQVAAPPLKKLELTKDVWIGSEPTRISNLKVKEMGKNYVVIYWETNHFATSKVSYGDSYDYGKDVQSDEKVKIHEIKVSGLKPNTTYYYEVMSQGVKNYVYDARHEFKTLHLDK